MLNNPTIEKLQSLRLAGMVNAFTSQLNDPKMSALSFDERFGLIVDEEELLRINKRMQSRIRQAKFKEQACFEDIEFNPARGLDKSFLKTLATSKWIDQGFNLIVTGACGVGKTYIATALAHKACRKGLRSLFLRVPRLFDEIEASRADGSYPRFMAKLAKIDALILDDWGLSKLTARQSRDVLEIIEDRHQSKSTIITSQLPVDKWYELIEDPTIADALFDRILHNSYKLELRGPSLRKEHSQSLLER